MAKKAIVLAAGLGTRLRPLTGVTPKPLMPVWGEPMLARIVNLLRSWGVDDIVVNCHYLHEQVEAWCAANGCRASYEPEILGTGGVLNPLRVWIGDDEFYLVNGDIVVEGLDRYPFPPKTFETCEVGAEVIASCLVTVEGPRTIEVEPESGFVTNWKSEDAGFEGTFTYCGLALLKPAILDYVEPTGFSTIVQAYERAMMDGKFVRAVEPKDLMWTDAGTIATYIDLNRDGADNAFADFPQLKEAFAAVPSATGDIEFLGARGSDRCFFRKGAALAIVYDDSKRGENARYAGHAKWLKAQGVAVPEILADLPAIKTLVMEHVGSTDLLARLGKPGVDRIGSYLPVVEALAKFNGLLSDAMPALEPKFGADLWKWERELFKEHCLGTRFQMECPADVERELQRVADLLEQEPKALVHRDFQSTNVIWKNDRFSFIDFQGMREGPAVYDLASLLYDPYVKLSETERRALAGAYGKACGRMDILKVLPFAAVQRLSQALGAYGRLASVGQPQFSKYVLPALENLLAAADEAGLDAVGALAEDLIAREEHALAQSHEGHACGCGHHHDSRA